MAPVFHRCGKLKIGVPGSKPKTPGKYMLFHKRTETNKGFCPLFMEAD